MLLFLGEKLVNLNYLKHFNTLPHYTEKKEYNYTLIAKKLTRVLRDCIPMEYRQ